MASWNGVKINRVKVTNDLPKFVEEREQRAARAITQALIIGGAEASVLTPIKSGTLINSQFRDVSQVDGAIRGRIGYTADYAQPVHDPAHPQTFRRPTAQKEFLKNGMENAEPAIRQVLKGAIKSR